MHICPRLTLAVPCHTQTLGPYGDIGARDQVFRLCGKVDLVIVFLIRIYFRISVSQTEGILTLPVCLLPFCLSYVGFYSLREKVFLVVTGPSPKNVLETNTRAALGDHRSPLASVVGSCRGFLPGGRTGFLSRSRGGCCQLFVWSQRPTRLSAWVSSQFSGTGRSLLENFYSDARVLLNWQLAGPTALKP